MSDLRDQVQAALGGAFTIDRELTGGGMSRVFVATETALGRKVVVKVLHPELAAEVTAERFSREIQLVARLQQANIVPLLTTGHTGTLPFYTMPFVEGLSLRQRLADGGRLPIPEAVNILRDVARALAYAHDAGVMHRDIKPENVLISGGAAVVTDFGIAKAVSASRTHAAAGTITQAGVSIGTPAYMAPEQAIGDPSTDHRADLYAFGCLAYELLAGRPPFDAAGAHELVAAQISATPVTIDTLRPDVPPGLAALVMRCLEKLPTERPQSARELLAGLETVNTPTGPVRVPRPRRRWAYAATALLVVVVVGIPLLRTREPATPPGPPAVAIIPFANVGGDSAQDYLADGLSDELATSVGKIPGVRLSARSGAYRYRGRRDIDVREVGKSLSVAYVVQGSVRRAGEQLRVSAQLTDAATGVEIWAQSFDRTTNDVFRTEDEITGAIATALASRVRLSGTPTVGDPGANRRGTADAAAYDLYMRAEFALRLRHIDEAVSLFRQSIARDARFARAYAGLSQTMALMPYFTATSATESFQKVLDAAQTALAIDSTLAEAWMARGMAYMHNRQWDEAGRQFERALAADPNDVQSHFQYGRYFLYRGETARAMAEWRRVRELDPFSALAAAWMAYGNVILGKPAEGVAEAKLALEYDPKSTVILLNVMRPYLAAHMDAEARRAADGMLPQPPWDGMRGYAYAVTGQRDTARAILRRLEAMPPTLWLRHTAMAMAAIGLRDTARAFDELSRATDANEMWANFSAVSDPLYDPLRRSRRWVALLKRVGLESVPGALK